MADGKTKTAADRRLISGTQRYEVNLRGKGRADQRSTRLYGFNRSGRPRPRAPSARACR